MSRNFKVGLFVTVAILATTFSFYFWQIFKTPNLQVDKQASFALLIPEGASYKSVLDTLNKHDVINDHISFRFLAKLLKYPEKVKAGRYVIKPGSNNYEVVKKLVSGNQDAVKLTFNNIRLKEDLIKRIGSRFEFGEANFRKALNDPAVCNKYGLDTLTIVSMFLPNTYEIYWTTGTEKFLDRMHSEYKKYWTDERIAKAKEIGLTPEQVSILASIVEEEQARKVDERPRVAGLYLNRLKAQMPLQADPTIKFALQDFGIKRILNGQLLIKSPYNTYINTGLPPGPIRVADLKSLDAVLNYDKHDYIYMCAKADLSGYHAFATNYADHLKNARLYQAELNRLQILK
ncbi:endolytic transglycosylase MltG [Dyadobacter sp. Leaf189]|uniref:endolytic transglycosylase MltG n=1 Tax=Dyadobacter sp. Leaf189 TaxID=1736295 RepID=UPI0006F9737E|nr:endolytic transglycosylase MltG [Dyadobacter sp. Leaf189]KQS33642.1 aminodeoxychorismate lyase [Dyadobacter sp. Leaf189]